MMFIGGAFDGHVHGRPGICIYAGLTPISFRGLAQTGVVLNFDCGKGFYTGPALVYFFNPHIIVESSVESKEALCEWYNVCILYRVQNTIQNTRREDCIRPPAFQRPRPGWRG